MNQNCEGTNAQYVCEWQNPQKNAFFGSIHIHTCIYICIDVYIHICACVCMCICVWICMCVCICMCTWIWIYLWMCMYVDVDGDLSFKRHVSSLAPADTSPKKIFELFLNLLKSFKKNNKIPGSNFFFQTSGYFFVWKKCFSGFFCRLESKISTVSSDRDLPRKLSSAKLNGFPPQETVSRQGSKNKGRRQALVKTSQRVQRGPKKLIVFILKALFSSEKPLCKPMFGIPYRFPRQRWMWPSPWG